MVLWIPFNNTSRIVVVYLDQHLGAAHSKHWLKYAFSILFCTFLYLNTFLPVGWSPPYPPLPPKKHLEIGGFSPKTLNLFHRSLKQVVNLSCLPMRACFSPSCFTNVWESPPPKKNSYFSSFSFCPSFYVFHAKT